MSAVITPAGYLGEISSEGQNLDFTFNSHDATGAPASIADGEVAIYRGNDDAEFTTGVTFTADFDSKTGLNHVRIESEEGGDYGASADFHVVLTAGTVGLISVVGTVIASFCVTNRFNGIGVEAQVNVANKVFGVELASGFSAQRILNIIAAAAGCKSSGFPAPGQAGTGTFRDVTDAVDQVVVTFDANGNRTAVTFGS